MALSLNVPQGPRDEKNKDELSNERRLASPDEQRSPTGSATAAAEKNAAPPKRPRPVVTVEEHVPERVHLELPSLVRHRWHQRVLAATATRAAGSGKDPPLRWYSQQLVELCGPTALQLAPKLHQLEEHRLSRPWIWKEGGHLPVMLEQCSVMLCDASQVAEAATQALLSAGPSAISASVRAVREKCFRATDVEPTIHACLECSTAEEAMALAQVELARLQGAGSALGCALRSFRWSTLELRKAFEDDQLFEDFMSLVPYLEMTLSKLQVLSDLVFHQLEEDFKVAPPDVDLESPLDGAQTIASVVEGSDSFAALWAAQAEDPEDPSGAQGGGAENDEAPMLPESSDAQEDEDREASLKPRKKGKKKTLTNSPKTGKGKK